MGYGDASAILAGRWLQHGRRRPGFEKRGNEAQDPAACRVRRGRRILGTVARVLYDENECPRATCPDCTRLTCVQRVMARKRLLILPVASNAPCGPITIFCTAQPFSNLTVPPHITQFRLWISPVGSKTRRPIRANKLMASTCLYMETLSGLDRDTMCSLQRVTVYNPGTPLVTEA